MRITIPSMNRLTSLLLTIAFAGAAIAQTAAQPQHKVIKDPAEYSAYMSAIGQIDPNAKAQRLETFLQQYPDTVVKEETLEQLLVAYMQAANKAAAEPPQQGALAGIVSRPGGIPAQRMVDTANSLFYVDPDNLRAIAVLVVNKQAQAKFLGPMDPQQVARLRRDAAELAKRGLRVIASKPRSPDFDFAHLSTLFNGALSMPSDPAKK